MAQMSMIQAINSALDCTMAADPSVLVYRTIENPLARPPLGETCVPRSFHSFGAAGPRENGHRSFED